MPANSMWLKDVGAKLSRAEEHFKAVEREIGSWFETSPYRVIKKVNADNTRHSATVRMKNRPSLQRWSLIVSDCVQNLRSALDYLVYAIAVQESRMDPPPDHRTLQFPITDSPDLFEKARWRIKSLTNTTQAILESVQPYHRPHPALPPLLAVLRDFNDSDKHRLLHVMLNRSPQGRIGNIRHPDGTVAVPSRIDVSVLDPIDEPEMVVLTFEKPTPNLKYEFEAHFVIAMTHAPTPVGPPDWTDVTGVLVRLIPEVRNIVDIVNFEFDRAQGKDIPSP